MAVSPLFQTDFARAGSPLEGLLGTFMDINIKEGKARDARELKAADPKGYLDIYKEALKNEREITKQLAQLGRKGASSGDTVRVSSSTPDPSRLLSIRQKMLEAQQRKADDYNAGKGAFANTGNQDRLRDALDDLENSDDPAFDQNIRGVIQRSIQEAKQSPGARTRSAGHGIYDVITEDLKNYDLTEKQKRIVFGEMKRAQIIPSPDDQETYANPQELTRRNQALLAQGQGGSTSYTKTTRGGTQGVDPSSMAKMLMNQLAVAKAETRRARSQYDQARAQYRELAAGPNRNLAFAPISTRPSQQSAALDEYTRLVEVDPERAAAIADASREAGEFTIADRLAELRADPDAKGRAPIDTVLDRVGALEALTGYSRGPTEPGAFGVDVVTRNLSAGDVPTVRQAMADMLEAVDAPMFEGQKFGSIDSMGDTLEFRNYLENGIAALDEFGEKDPKLATQVAEDFAKELVDWKDSQDESELQLQRADNQPGYAVSRSINRIRTAKRQADKTGNKKVLQDALADESNKIRATDDFSRSAYGDAFLEDVNDFLDHQDVDYFENNLVELQAAAEEAAVTETDMEM